MFFFINHFKGEYRLYFSFFVNFIILYMILFEKILGDFFFEYGSDITSPSVIIFLVLKFILLFVVIVGLWRSANASSHGNFSFFTKIIIFLKLTSIFVAINFHIIFLDKNMSHVSNFIYNNSEIEKQIIIRREILMIDGPIGYGMTNKIKKYFKEYPKINLLMINSKGGPIYETNKLARYIKSRQITTFVSNYCENECIDIFVAGNNRVIENNAKLVFNKPDNLRLIKNITSLISNNYFRDFSDFYLDSAISKKFTRSLITLEKNKTFTNKILKHHNVIQLIRKDFK